MPPREASAYLIDLIDASDSILSFLADADEQRYQSDKLLRSAVERQLMIVGESVVQLRRLDEERTASLGPVRSIVAFRNILIHAYFTLDNRVVWNIASSDMPGIANAAREWLSHIRA